MSEEQKSPSMAGMVVQLRKENEALKEQVDGLRESLLQLDASYQAEISSLKERIKEKPVDMFVNAPPPWSARNCNGFRLVEDKNGGDVLRLLRGRSGGVEISTAISALPELLQAAELSLEWAPECFCQACPAGPGSCDRCIVEAAVKKARGE